MYRQGERGRAKCKNGDQDRGAACKKCDGYEEIARDSETVETEDESS
jgi:hypothetical protein